MEGTEEMGKITDKISLADGILKCYEDEGLEAFSPRANRLIEEYLSSEESKKDTRAASEKYRRTRESENERILRKIAEPYPWAGSVPIHERFVVMKVYYRGKNALCPVDLLRGYSAPYFGFYGGFTEGDETDVASLAHCHNRIMKSLFILDGRELWSFVREWMNFFKMDNDNPYRKDLMSVVNYRIDKDDNIEIVGEGEKMTFDEHRKSLFAKYETKGRGGRQK